MKKTILFFLIYLLLFFQNSHAQLFPNWTQTYGVSCCPGFPPTILIPIIRDLKVSVNGDVYVLNTHYTFTIAQPFLAEEFEIRKYNSYGVLLQQYQYIRGVFKHYDIGYKLVIDPNNNVFVAGTEKNYNENKTRAFLYKFNSSLGLLWSKPIDSVFGYNSNIGIINMLIDSSGKLRIVSNSSDSTSTGYIPRIVNQKISNSGIVNYTKIFTAGNFTYASDAQLDNASNIVICGNGQNLSPGNQKYVVLKYSPSGNLVFSKTSLTINNQIVNSSVNSMTIDSQNNIYVTGSSYPNTGPPSVCLVKYDSTGVKKWVKNLGTTIDGYGLHVGLADSNTVSVLAMINDSIPGQYYYPRLIKYKTSSAFVSDITLYNLGEYYFNNGLLYLTSRGTGNTFHTRCYDDSGNVLWMDDYIQPLSGLQLGTHLAFGPGNSLIIGGFDRRMLTSIHAEFVVIRRLSPVQAKEEISNIENKQLVIYPNPSSEEITIDWKGVQEFSGNEEIIIYNYLGEKIFSAPIIYNETSSSINIKEWNNGIYFIKLKGEKGTEFTRFVVSGN